MSVVTIYRTLTWNTGRSANVFYGWIELVLEDWESLTALSTAKRFGSDAFRAHLTLSTATSRG